MIEDEIIWVLLYSCMKRSLVCSSQGVAALQGPVVILMLHLRLIRAGSTLFLASHTVLGWSSTFQPLLSTRHLTFSSFLHKYFDMQELGMFMTCLQVISSNNIVDKVCRSSVLEFRSKLLQVLDDLFSLPLFVLGSCTKRQTISVIYYRWTKYYHYLTLR